MSSGAHRHSLLRRQLERHAPAGVPDELGDFITAVEAAYRAADEDREMLERSLDLSTGDLRQTNADLRAVMRLLPDLFLRMGLDGRILEGHGPALAALGWTEEDLRNRLLSELPETDATRQFGRALADVRAGVNRVVVEYQTARGGEDRHFEGAAFPMAGAQVLFFVRDITVRRQAEGERDRLVTAVEQAAETITITDTRGTILYVNPAFVRITGYARDEVVGQNPRVLKSGRHNPTDYREMWQALVQGRVWRTRFTNRRKDGSTYELEATISPIRGARRQIVNYVMVGRDVTREVELEEQLRQAQKMEAVGRLAGGIAHDFNNLLTAILGNVELALARMAPDDPVRVEVQEIGKASTRAAELTSQLLAFGRRQVLHPRVIDLNHVMRDQANLLRRLLGERVQMAYHLEPALWPVKADPAQLEHVVMNLAINARDAMEAGGQLTLGTDNLVVERDRQPPHHLPAGRYVRLSVRDTGIGMDERVRAHLFEPFFTTKPRGRGTGLGLATVYGIVKQSDGHIAVESAPGQGSVFTVYLPAASGDPEPAPAGGAASATRSGAETVLLVEDEDQVRRVTRMVLERQGYQVIEAATPNAALTLARGLAGPLGLLLTDVSMPEMNGDDLAARMQALRPGLRVLFMSGHPDASRGLRHMVEGGRLFLKKPFTQDDLVRKVREVLDAP